MKPKSSVPHLAYTSDEADGESDAFALPDYGEPQLPLPPLRRRADRAASSVSPDVRHIADAPFKPQTVTEAISLHFSSSSIKFSKDAALAVAEFYRLFAIEAVRRCRLVRDSGITSTSRLAPAGAAQEVSTVSVRELETILAQLLLDF